MEAVDDSAAQRPIEERQPWKRRHPCYAVVRRPRLRIRIDGDHHEILNRFRHRSSEGSRNAECGNGSWSLEDAQEGDDALDVDTRRSLRFHAGVTLGQVSARRSPEVHEPTVDRERVPAVRASEHPGLYAAISELVGEQNEAERRPAPRATQTIRQE